MGTFFNSSSSNASDFNTISEIIRLGLKIKDYKTDQNDICRAINLFEVILKLIKTNGWEFNEEGSNLTPYEILELPANSFHKVNSFNLSNLFIAACCFNGILNSKIKIFYNRPLKKIGTKSPYNETVLSSFDNNDEQFVDGEVIFDQHAVAQVADHYFDLMFSTYYINENDVFDNSLFGNLVSCVCDREEEKAISLLHQSKNKFDIDKTYAGYSLLHRAVWLGLFNLVFELISLGASTNLKTKDMFSQIPLQCLNLANPDDLNSEIFTVLSKDLSYEDIIDIKLELVEKLAINTIIEGGLSAFLSLITQRKMDLNLPDCYGFTLLHYAALYANNEIINWLLDNNANPNLLNNDGCSPLELFFNVETVAFERLVSLTDPNIIYKLTSSNDPAKRQIFWYVDRVIAEGRIDLLDKLFNIGIDVNIRDPHDNGNTLLHKAAHFLKEDVINFLIDKNANIQLENNDGHTAKFCIQQAKEILIQQKDLAIQIKKRSEEIIISCGGEILDWLPIRELGEPRPQQQIINRALVLNAMHELCLKAPKSIISEWILENDLWQDLSFEEESILRSENELTYDELGLMYWSLDSLWALVWATGLVSSLSFEEEIGDELAGLSPDLKINENGDKYNQNMILRPAILLYEMRDLYYRAHWWVKNIECITDDVKLLYNRIYARRKALEWILNPKEDWDNVDLST